MKAVAALCVGCGLASLLPAVVVTFDDLPPANWASDAFLSGGFLFSQTLPLVSREFALISIPGDCFPSCVDNGTQYLADFSRDNGFEITQANGLPFALLEFDASELFPGDEAAGRGYPNALTIVLQGQRSDASLVAACFALDGDGVFHTFTLPSGWTDLVTVSVGATMDGSTLPIPNLRGGFAVDNFVVEIPEPATWALLALGMAFLGRRLA